MNPPTGWAKTDYAANYLMIPNRGTASLSAFRGGSSNYPITLSDIKDGAGNTILVGEKALVVAAYNTGGWYWDEPIFAGGSGGTARGVLALPSPPAPSPNTNWGTPFYSQQAGFPPLPFNYPPGMVPDSDPNMFNNFGSAHPGGVNFLFADGSVRTFNYNVDLSLFQGLLTPAGGDPTPPES